MANKRLKQKYNVRFIIISSIRILLFLAFVSAITKGRNLIFLMSLFALFLTFLPKILNKVFKIKMPGEFEVTLILFIYGILLFGEMRGYYAGIWWLSSLLNLFSAVALGFVGITVLHVLYKDDRINASPLIIAVFSFCFAVAVGALWEVFEFSLDRFLSFSLQRASLFDTMADMIANIAGAFVVSYAGYFYIKNGKLNLISKLISTIVERNPKIFKSKKIENPQDKVYELINEGESGKLEFKSKLRTNLHTNQVDKKIEHASLKTITAYLNSNGGTLLVGVGDDGEILGVEKDQFQSIDKLNLHFTNLVKNHIGNEYLPFIKFEVINIEGKYVLKVDCEKSYKHVFLKMEGEEEFYIRNGPSSVRLSGSALVDYINHNFFNREL